MIAICAPGMRLCSAVYPEVRTRNSSSASTETKVSDPPVAPSPGIDPGSPADLPPRAAPFTPESSANPVSLTRPNRGSLALRLAGSRTRVLRRLTYSSQRPCRYMLNRQLPGELLSVHEISQAYPGAPRVSKWTLMPFALRRGGGVTGLRHDIRRRNLVSGCLVVAHARRTLGCESSLIRRRLRSAVVDIQKKERDHQS